MKIYKELVKACGYCPKNSPDWWSNESFCTAFQPAKAFKGQYLKGFPSWCPLEDYREDKKDKK